MKTKEQLEREAGEFEELTDAMTSAVEDMAQAMDTVMQIVDEAIALGADFRYAKSTVLANIQGFLGQGGYRTGNTTAEQMIDHLIAAMNDRYEAALEVEEE